MSEYVVWVRRPWHNGPGSSRVKAVIPILLVDVLGILTACGQVSSRQPGTSTAVIMAPATTVTATPTSAPTAPNCTADQLQLASVHGGVAAGNVSETFSFTNASANACSLRGFPNARLLDASKQPLSIQVHQQTASMMFNMSIQTIVLAPQASAHFIVEWVDEASPGQTCPTGSYLSVTPPNSAQWIAVAATIAPCGAQLTVSPVEAAQ